MCGGTNRCWWPAWPAPGLSPRVRGNLAGGHPQPLGGRSIPACAGEPTTPLTPTASPWVYPRVCGGTGRSYSVANDPEGLSPRVRGNLVGGSPAPVSRRSIPACAGEPRGAYLGRSGGGVYPRVCGGTVHRRPARQGQDGLSPRVRGNPMQVPLLPQVHRSIPACAGEPRHLPAAPGRR